MKNFIYDRYGYYLEEDSESFDYQNYHFCLVLNEKSIVETEEINNYIIGLSEQLFNKKSYIVPTRDNQLIALSSYGNVSLVAVENFNVNLDSLKMMHQVGMNHKSIKLSNIKNKWIHKLELVEQKIVPSLKIEEYYYQLVIICVTHAIGLASNAISYLEDTIIDFGEEINVTTLTHKRIKLNSFDLLNPFNLIVDSPVRDLSELYKNDQITFEELIDLLYEYHVGPKEASILLSRVLYPSELFDLLEDHYQKRGDITYLIKNYYENVDRNINKIKKLHSYLTSNYGIRKINWLNN